MIPGATRATIALPIAVAILSCSGERTAPAPTEADTPEAEEPARDLTDSGPVRAAADAGLLPSPEEPPVGPLMDELLARLPMMGFDAVKDTRSPGAWIGSRRRALKQAGACAGKSLLSIRVIRFRARTPEIAKGQRWYPEGWAEEWTFSSPEEVSRIAERLGKTKGLDAQGISHFFGVAPHALYARGDRILSIQMRARSWAAHVGNVTTLLDFLSEGREPPLEEVFYLAGDRPGGPGGRAPAKEEKSRPATGDIPAIREPAMPEPKDPVVTPSVGGIPWPKEEMMSIRLSPGEAGRSMVLVGAPTVDGPLSEEQVGAVVLPGLDSLDACLEKHIDKRPGLTGTTLLDIVVTSTGRVTSSTPTDSTIHDDGLERCLAKASMRWRFPAYEGKRITTITVPLRLDSGE